MSKLFQKLTSIALICFSLAGCSKSIKKGTENMETTNSSATGTTMASKDDTFELTIMNSKLDEDYIKEQLKEIYPNATCKIIKLEEDSISSITSSLYSGNVPDIIFYDINQFSQLNSIDGFEDLFNEPYNAVQLKDIYTENEWNKGLSFAGNHKIAIPLSPSVAVTFYRADIFEQCGITSDPEQLGQLISTSAGWLSVGEKLRKQGKYSMDWKSQILELYNYNGRVFDKEMNIKVDKKLIADILNTSNKAGEMGFESNVSIWTSRGQEAVRKGNMPLLYLGDWGIWLLKSWAPETFGKWRVTNLPFGIKREWGQTFISIPTKAKYKEQAWNIIKKFTQDDKTNYNNQKDATYEFLGNQKANIIFDKIRADLPYPFFTPMDEEVKALWKSGLYTAFNKNDTENIIDNTERDIKEKFDKEIQYLVNYIKNVK